MIKEMVFKINNELVSAECDPAMRFIDFLREELHLTGTKEGCSEGECGACSILLDGEVVNACLLLVGQVEGSEVETIEGISKDPDVQLLQESFIKTGAVQCGYCTPGVIIALRALLLKNPEPSTKQIKEAISGNLCRCTGYTKIIEAVEEAVKGV